MMLQSTWKFKSRLHPCRFVRIFGTVASGWMCSNLHMSEKVNGSREIRMHWEQRQTHVNWTVFNEDGTSNVKTIQLHRKTHFMGLLLLAWCWCFATVEDVNDVDSIDAIEIIDND